jgi:uncharacterized protein
MPSALTFPGVYIDEVQSGVRTITGVPTAICAFLGRTSSGPVDTPVILNSFGDFERSHGGLEVDFPVSYSIRDFFLNGGSQAIVVRLYGSPAITSPPSSPPTATDGIARFGITASAGAPPFTLQAASPGAWANSLRINIIPVTDAAVVTALGLPPGTDLFDIVVKTPDPNNPTVFITLERLRNVAFADTARDIDRVLPSESAYLRISGSGPDPATNANARLVNYTTGPTVDYSISGPGPVPTAPGADSQKVGDTVIVGSQANKTGMFALEKADLFNLLCIPPDTRAGEISATVMGQAATYCQARRAMFIADPPLAWTSATAVNITNLGINGLAGRNAAVYFPRILQADPLRGGQLDTFAPSGTVAGAIANTDARRGVFKAPAGVDVGLVGVRGLSISGGQPFNLTDAENGLPNLNPAGVNCLRIFPVIGPVTWGARTVRGADQLSDDYKYLPVRRLALFIEESLFRGTKFAVFEPNDEPLWSQIRLNVGAFMQNLFRQGAFQGQSPRDAYFVKCDKETTTQNDINLGVVNIIVAFAPLKPAEFVVIKIQQIAGQMST